MSMDPASTEPPTGRLLYEERVDEHLVELFDEGTKGGRPSLGFRVHTDDTLVWQGHEFTPSGGVEPASTEAVAELLTWVTLRPGDTDDEFFDGHTAEQHDWLARHADDLSAFAHQVENGPYELGNGIDVQVPSDDGPRWSRGFVRDIARFTSPGDEADPSSDDGNRARPAWSVEVHVPVTHDDWETTVVHCGHDGFGDGVAPEGEHYPPPFDGPDPGRFFEESRGSAEEWVEVVRAHRGGELSPEDVELLPEHAAHIYGRARVQALIGEPDESSVSL